MMNNAASLPDAKLLKAAYKEIQVYMRDQQFVTSLYETDQMRPEQEPRRCSGLLGKSSLSDLYQVAFERQTL